MMDKGGRYDKVSGGVVREGCGVWGKEEGKEIIQEMKGGVKLHRKRD